MERSRKLALTDRTKANDALNQYFEGNKSKLSKHLDMSRTTVTNFFNQQPVREAEFRKVCLALRLKWQEVSAVEEIAPSEEKWIEEVRSRCCQKILYQHGKIQLLNQTEIEVDQLYVDVWLLDRSPRTFQVSEDALLKSFDLRNDRLGLGERIQRNEGIAVANENSKLLILGKPGSGKTTFIKHLAVDCSNGKFQSDLIPVLIELRKIRSTDRIVSVISEQLSLNSEQTQILLEQGKLLILMDGLDEVSTNSFRRDVQEQLLDLALERKYLGNRFIITCRTQIIEVIPQGFTSVEVADFNNEQVEKFVKNWFRASGQAEAEIKQPWQAFADAIQDNSALRELTVTPVLLSLMCWVFQDSGEMPSQTASLYQKGIRLLLEKWNGRKEIPGWEMGNEVYRTLNIDQKEALLTEIAARKFENPTNFVLFEQEVLAQQIAAYLKLNSKRDGAAVLKAIEAQHGLLVERADELWSFSHLTFQEHFTVQWLTKLSPKQLAEKIENSQWQRTVEQLVKSQPADKLLKLIKRAIDYSVSQDTSLQKFLTWVQEKAEEIKASYKPAAIRAFYFALVRALPLTRSLACSLDCFFDHHVYYFADGIVRAHDRAGAITYDDNFVRNLTHVRSLAFTITVIFTHTSDPVLASKLEKVTAKLPKRFAEDCGSFQRWWKRNGQLWTSELQKLIEHPIIGESWIAEYPNIAAYWQFTESQERALQHYYDANQFLVELLQQPGAVSDTVRQEIEDNLLLPIATLRERQPDIYGE